MKRPGILYLVFAAVAGLPLAAFVGWSLITFFSEPLNLSDLAASPTTGETSENASPAVSGTAVPPAPVRSSGDLKPGTLIVEEGEPDAKSAHPDSLQEAYERLHQLEVENRQLAEERNQFQAQLSDMLNWMLKNYKGKYPLPEKLMAKLRLTPVNEDITLNKDVVELLEISPEVEATINQAFYATRLFLDQMEAALMTVDQTRDDKVTLRVPAFGEEGELVREDLYNALEKALGSDRFVRFLTVSENELDSNFQKFGGLARTIVFELVFAEDGITPLLKIRDGWIEDTAANEKTINATETVVAELPDKYLAYIDWIPPLAPTAPGP